MISLRLDQHAIKSEQQVVEIVDADGMLLGVIYPQEWGIKIVSKYLGEEGIAFADHLTPAVLEVKLP